MKEKKFSFGTFMQKYAVVAVWIVLIIVYSVIMPDTFATWNNITSMLSSKAAVAVLSLAIMIPLIAGDYDMSVAANMTLTSMMVAIMNVWWGFPIWIAIILSLVIACLVGAINGLFSAILDINPFVITMGMQTLITGMVILISNSTTITGVDTRLVSAVYSSRIFGISPIFFYMIIITLILFYFFTFTSAGKRLIIVGRGRNVAKLSGINVKRVRFLCFVAAGFFSGIAGVLQLGVLGAASTNSGLNYLMPAFAAVYLSSTVISPGRFNPWGCVIAVYFLVTGTTGLSLMGINSAVQDVFYGAALIIAIVVSVSVERRQQKREIKTILQQGKSDGGKSGAIDGE
ncbi:MAG: ABC transporter permease [Firmicutes bacterium]|nr:ABC transporter permease [Bacillota bacterium]